MKYHVHTATGTRITRQPVSLWVAERIAQDARQNWGYACEVRIEPPRAWETQIATHGRDICQLWGCK